MRRRQISIITSVIACTLVLAFLQNALALEPLKPSGGQIQKFEPPKPSTPNQGTPNQGTPTPKLSPVTGQIISRIYNVHFADNILGSAFDARFILPTTNSLKWQYYFNNSQLGPLSPPLNLESKTDYRNTHIYYVKRYNENNILTEEIFSISFSDNYTSLVGVGNFIYHGKNGKIERRFYNINGQKVN